MNDSHFQNSSFEKGRRGWDVPAASLGIAEEGKQPRPANQRAVHMREQSTKFRSEDVRFQNGTHAPAQRAIVPAGKARKSSAQIAQRASELRPFSTAELNRETQCLVLQFPTAQAADEQGACLRAVESQKNGESGISTVKLINWARRNPRVRAEIARLIGLEGAVTDPDFMQVMSLAADYFVAKTFGPVPTSCQVDPSNFAGDEEKDLATGDLFEGLP